MKCRNGPTTFLPLSPKIGGLINDYKPSIGQYLTKEQATFVYKKTESGEMINTETLQQELEHERQLNKIDDTNEDTNSCKEMIVNNVEKIEPLLAQMEQWSILSNTLNYIQYNKHPKNFHNLGISAVNVYKNCSDVKKEKRMVEIDFGPTLDILKKEYLNIYEGIQSEILKSTRFNEDLHLSTTYLWKSDRSKNDKLKAEEFFSHVRARVIVEVGGHRFEIYTLASEIHENVDIVLGIKNIFKLEGVIKSWDCCFKFLNRSLPIFLKERVVFET